MSIFDSLGKSAYGSQGQVNPVQALQQLRSNPAAVLRQAGLNVPENLVGDPQKIINHLLQSGQIPQGRYQQAMQMMGQMAGRR